jgi:hypothetical protein
LTPRAHKIKWIGKNSYCVGGVLDSSDTILSIIVSLLRRWVWPPAHPALNSPRQL